MVSLFNIFLATSYLLRLGVFCSCWQVVTYTFCSCESVYDSREDSIVSIPLIVEVGVDGLIPWFLLLTSRRLPTYISLCLFVIYVAYLFNVHYKLRGEWGSGTGRVCLYRVCEMAHCVVYVQPKQPALSLTCSGSRSML